MKYTFLCWGLYTLADWRLPTLLLCLSRNWNAVKICWSRSMNSGAACPDFMFLSFPYRVRMFENNSLSWLTERGKYINLNITKLSITSQIKSKPMNKFIEKYMNYLRHQCHQNIHHRHYLHHHYHHHHHHHYHHHHHHHHHHCILFIIYLTYM